MVRQTCGVLAEEAVVIGMSALPEPLPVPAVEEDASVENGKLFGDVKYGVLLPVVDAPMGTAIPAEDVAIELPLLLVAGFPS